nr:DUF3524 domain-containing protein [Spirochaetia bacterium]
EYIALLKEGDIIISTSNQENYGISVIEAILSGCRPILPRRLSYPEIIPEEYHSKCLYSDEKDLSLKLKKLLTEDIVFKLNGLIDRMAELCWDKMITKYDKLFDNIISGEKL